MRIVRGQCIDGELLEVDGNHFIDCNLTECILQYAGGHVVMERTRVTGCHHVFVGPARLTVNSLESMELVPPNSPFFGLENEILH